MKLVKIALSCTLLLLISCKDSGTEPAATPEPGKTPAETTAETQSTLDEIKQDAEDTVDYMTGKTQLEAKKKMENQIQNLQNTHSKQLEEATK